MRRILHNEPEISDMLGQRPEEPIAIYSRISLPDKNENNIIRKTWRLMMELHKTNSHAHAHHQRIELNVISHREQIHDALLLVVA